MTQGSMGERIKYYRKSLGLTQEQLAERMGVTPQAVSKWENDLSCPDISALPRLAEIFGISADALLGREEASGPEPREKTEGFTYRWQGAFYAAAFGILVLVFGGLWLMNSLLGLEVSWWTLLWTLFLVYIGACSMKGHFSFVGAVLILLGGGFLLKAYGVLRLDWGWNVVLPLCIILGGIGILVDTLLKRRRKMRRCGGPKGTGKCSCACQEGVLRAEMAFGDYRETVSTPCLRRGTVETSFGNTILDFSGVEAVAPDCALRIENSFGNLTLEIPRRYVLSVGSAQRFASCITTHGGPDPSPAGEIRLESLECSFGSVELRYI